MPPHADTGIRLFRPRVDQAVAGMLVRRAKERRRRARQRFAPWGSCGHNFPRCEPGRRGFRRGDGAERMEQCGSGRIIPLVELLLRQ